MNASSASKRCRICCNNQFNDLVSLLDAENKTIVKKLRACADITIEHDDMLPKYICKKCWPKLNAAYNFKIQCEFMDQKFRENISSGLQQYGNLKAIMRNDSTTCDEIDSDETDSCEFDIQQTWMNDGETAIEDYEKQDSVLNNPFARDLPENHIDEPIMQFLPTIKAETNAMDISPRPIEIEKIDSLGSLPSARGPDDLTDQEMVSLKSEKISPTKSNYRFKCDTCDATFSNHSEYNKHTKTHGKLRFQCKVCNKWFAKKYLLNAHQKTHGGSKSFECSTCQKRYTTQTNLDRHIRIFHKKILMHTCNTCKKTFSQLSTLRLHQSVHIEKREFSCDICDSKFKTEVQMKFHRKRHLLTEYRPKRKYVPAIPTVQKKTHKPPLKPCVCDECGKRFSSTSLLRSHLQSHSTEKKYECKYCNKRFSFQSSLRNHIYLHTGEKRYKCDVCSISFRQIGHLQGHKLVHSGTKPHSCPTCGKAFSLRSNLTVHMRTHSGATPYHCTICPKKFSESNALKRHQLMHQRKNQTVPLIKQILEAPIIEECDSNVSTSQAPNTQSSIIQGSKLQAPGIIIPRSQTPVPQVPLVGTTFEAVPIFNEDSKTIHYILPPNLTGADNNLTFRVE